MDFENKRIRLISYNCQSFNAKTAVIESLLLECDILCLQETLINDENSFMMDCLNNNFVVSYVPSVRRNDVTSGRSSGGLAIFFRKTSDIEFYPLKFSERIMGLRVKINNIVYLLLNIYCYCDYGDLDSLLNYKSILADLSNICDAKNFDEIIIVGDANADPSKGRFFEELQKFIDFYSLILSDINSLPSSSYSYISSNSICSTSWLDHVITSKSQLVKSHQILYGYTFYDHIPIFCEIPIPCTPNFDLFRGPPTCDQMSVMWDKVTNDLKTRYCQVLDQYALYLWDNVLACDKSDCNNDSHSQSLERIYQFILEIVSLASDELPNYNKKAKNLRIVGWNEYCKDRYATARYWYLKWHNEGRIRNNEIFDQMKSSRLEFKNALKFCRKNEAKIRKENLLRKFNSPNISHFWKEVNKISGNQSNDIPYIDGKSDLTDIVEVFDAKFFKVLTNPQCQKVKSTVVEFDNENLNLPLISLNNINKSIFDINGGLGWDKIHSNHLKFSSPIFRNLLCKIFNKFLTHKFVPRQMLAGQIKPVVKNKSFGKTDSSNYRPIMKSSNFLKIFEYCLLPSINTHIKLNNRQFGFRKNAGCSAALVLAKEIINKYTVGGSNVHCAMVDLSKAFDMINFSILIKKLHKTGLPKQIVNIIGYMLKNTYINTLVNNMKTDPWRAENGTRQGGILSPLLFSFYINEMIDEISEMNVGCSLGGVRVNIICYADDICLLAPSRYALQLLLDHLQSCLKYLDLNINVNKCAYIIFKKHKRDYITSEVTLEGVKIPRVAEFKYLGVILSEDLSISADINRVLMSFLKQFNSMYHKFHYMDDPILQHLFRTYTSSFYGVDIWFDRYSHREVNRLEVTYHKAVKRVARLNVWDSNHEACDIIKVPTFPHLVAKRLICLFHSIINSSSPCLFGFKYYLRYESFFFKYLNNFFNMKYEVLNFMQNPLCAMLSRIDFVQKHEPRRR